MDKKIIDKFLNNRCTNEEVDEILQWAKKDAFNEESLGWRYDEWKNYRVKEDTEDDERFRFLFDKIRHKINLKDQKRQAKEKKFLFSPVFISVLTKAAAVLLIPVLALLFYFVAENRITNMRYSNMMSDSLEVVSPVGGRTVINLPDGSVAHLNYDSKIRYPQTFSGSVREVELSGEGYFEVSHNPKKPFIVKARGMNVTAIGTVFNVMAYPEDREVETTLVEGKVVLAISQNNGKKSKIGSLVPGQHVIYDVKENKILSTKGSVEKYIAWTDGRLVFEDTPITEAIQKLSRMFNVDIEIANDVQCYSYTVVFRDETLSQILDMMTIATPINYSMFPGKKLPDGSFLKPKILITKK